MFNLQVKFLLKNMNPETVKLEVDCVVGVGECDDLGKFTNQKIPSTLHQFRTIGIKSSLTICSSWH